jgi:hypothetical protein
LARATGRVAGHYSSYWSHSETDTLARVLWRINPAYQSNFLFLFLFLSGRTSSTPRNPIRYSHLVHCSYSYSYSCSYSYSYSYSYQIELLLLLVIRLDIPIWFIVRANVLMSGGFRVQIRIRTRGTRGIRRNLPHLPHIRATYQSISLIHFCRIHAMFGFSSRNEIPSSVDAD